MSLELNEELSGIPDNDPVPVMYPLLAELNPEDWEDAALFEEQA